MVQAKKRKGRLDHEERKREKEKQGTWKILSPPSMLFHPVGVYVGVLSVSPSALTWIVAPVSSVSTTKAHFLP